MKKPETKRKEYFNFVNNIKFKMWIKIMEIIKLLFSEFSSTSLLNPSKKRLQQKLKLKKSTKK